MILIMKIIMNIIMKIIFKIKRINIHITKIKIIIIMINLIKNQKLIYQM